MPGLESWCPAGRWDPACSVLREFDRVVLEAMQAVYDQWPEAQWVDEVRGIGMVTAVSILAHIGPIERFPTAGHLISYTGLAPGPRRLTGGRRRRVRRC